MSHLEGMLSVMTFDLPDETIAGIQAANALAAEGDVAAAERAYDDLLRSVEGDDRQAAAIAHMYAIVVADPHRKLEINELALEHAKRSGDFPAPLCASLYANVGYSHRELGDRETAIGWYRKAEVAAAGLDDDDYGRAVRDGIASQLRILTT